MTRAFPKFVLLSVIALFAASCGADTTAGSDPAINQGTDINSALTGEVETIDGPTIDLADYQNSDLVVWFWAPW